MRVSYFALLAVFMLLSSTASAPLTSADRAHVYTETVGADGWTVITIPGGGYIADIEYTVSRSWRGAAAHPLVYATLPDPGLWSRLSSLSLIPPASAVKPEPLVVRDSRVAIVAVPGTPGSKVTVHVIQGEGGGEGKPLMVIIVPDGDVVAREYAEKIASLHSGDMVVKIVTTREAATQYPAAPEPEGICKPGEDTAPKYNLSLALHIVGMERELLGKGLRFLLIIGGAKDVPPIYYCSPILKELVSPSEGVVPSDYYYRDPDYDGVAEVAVGRIPFTDPVSLAGYYSALTKWVHGGEWQSYALVSGGAPFASTLFVGEAAAATAAQYLVSMNLTVDMFLLDRGNYDGFRLTGYLGRYGVYYIMAHGSGSSLLDYLPGGLWNYDFQELLNSREVNGLGNPGLFVLPACRDGYWDADLVKPPFQPPSLANALLGKGAAVAYVGFSRVAIELIDGVSLFSGRLAVSMAGADRLLLEFVEALGEVDTIGEAFSNALSSYIALPASHYRAYLAEGEEEIGTLVARSAVLLGDPAAPAPWRASGGAGSGSGLRAEGAVNVGAALLAPTLARYTTGTMPAINPGASGTVIVSLDGGCPGELHAYSLRRVSGTALIGMEELQVSASEANGRCRVAIRVPASSPGLVRLLAVSPDGVASAYYLVAAGAYVDREKALLVLRGLDVLGVIGDEPLLLQADNATVMLLEGARSSVFIPLSALGRQGFNNVTVTVRPLYDTASIYGGDLVSAEAEKLEPLFRVNVLVTNMGGPLPSSAFFPLGRGGGAAEDCRGLNTEAATGLAVATLAIIIACGVARRRRASGVDAAEAPGYVM